jgi:hypothetical protein
MEREGAFNSQRFETKVEEENNQGDRDFVN